MKDLKDLQTFVEAFIESIDSLLEKAEKWLDNL